MVKGLDVFESYFGDFPESYTIIGGTACDRQFAGRGLVFRATKDIDLVLVIEALHPDFVRRFWEFIKVGGYDRKQVEPKERKYYRFEGPEDESFPVLIELFSRRPDVIQEIEGMHLTPVPVEEDLSSLSAILLDDDYYRFVIGRTEQIGGLSVASVEALIALKVCAYLNMLQRKADGEHIDSNKIRKHRNDILKLAITLPSESNVRCPEKIKNDIGRYIALVGGEQPDIKNMFKEMGIDRLDMEELLTRMETTFVAE